MDVDLPIDTSLENEARVYQALEILPDQTVKELSPGEASQYSVVRVGQIASTHLGLHTSRHLKMP